MLGLALLAGALASFPWWHGRGQQHPGGLAERSAGTSGEAAPEEPELPETSSGGNDRVLARSPTASERRPLEFEPGGGVTLEGRVIDERRQAVPGLDVALEEPRPTVAGRPEERRAPRERCRTDAEGRFEFRGLGPRTWRIRVAGEALADETEIEVNAGLRDPRELTIHVFRGGAIAGTVAWPDGSAVESFEVWADGPGGRRDGQGQRGEFRIGGLWEGPFGRTYDVEVRARRPGSIGRASIPDTPLDSPPLHLVLEQVSVFVLEGRVVDRDGAPVHGAWVEAIGRAEGGRTATTTPGDGTFRLTDLCPGTWTIEAFSLGFLRAREELVFRSTPPAPLCLVLHPAGRIRGHVVDDQGRPVAGASVTADGGYETATDAEGAFAILAFATHIEVHASDPRYSGDALAVLDVGAGESVEGLVLRLDHGCRVEGRVLDAAGVPVVGASVTAVSPGRASLAESDADGGFFLAALPAGPIEVRAFDRGRGRRASAPLTVVSERVAWVELRFAPEIPVLLRGRITRHGRPEECSVALWSPSFVASAECGPDGRFEVTLPGPGPWQGALSFGRWPDPGRGEVRRFELDVAGPLQELELAFETLPRAGPLDDLDW